MIPEWVRRLPCPVYGNYGGRARKCRGERCPEPVDQLDGFYRQHDADLYSAAAIEDPWLRRESRERADQKLAKGLRRLSWQTAFKQPIYGRLYWLGSMLIFRP